MKTKQFSAIFLLLLGMTLSSCKDNITAFEFSHDYAAINIIVDPTNTMGDLTFTTREIETDIQKIASDNGVSVNNLKSVKISEVIVTLIDINANPYTFDLLDRIDSKIGKTSDSTLVTFAGKNPVPDGGLTEFKLDVNNVELLDYFKSNRLKFQLSGFTNDSIDHAFNLKVELKIAVKGEVID